MKIEIDVVIHVFTKNNISLHPVRSQNRCPVASKNTEAEVFKKAVCLNEH